MVEKIDIPVQTQIILDKVLLFGTQYANPTKEKKTKNKNKRKKKTKKKKPKTHSTFNSFSQFPSINSLIFLRSMTAIGQPLLTNVKVLAEVEEQALASKVLVFKKKRRHGYKRFKGHRQPYTLLRVKDILAKKD